MIGERRNPLHLSKREVCFGDKKNNIGDKIDNLLEHLSLPKGHIFGIRERGE